MNKIIISILSLYSISAFASYEKYFPTYFEYCSGTQYKLNDGTIGGKPGHGFNYIHGLCKDYSSAYPKVIPCDQVTNEYKELYPHEGVGISLDKNFMNVMWIAVPGREAFLFGNKERKVITYSDIDEQNQLMTSLKVFEGVKSKSEKLKGLEFGTDEYLEAISLSTLGTDHALNWAREMHCVKIPFNKNKLQKLADYLNKSNEQFKENDAYTWNKFSNNCVQLSINSSAEIGLNKKILTDQKNIKKLQNIALPSNAFMMYADKSVLSNLPSFSKLQEDLINNGFIQAQVGSIMIKYDAYPSGDMFNTFDLKTLVAPRVKKPANLLMTPKKYEKKYMDKEYVDLKENSKLWIKKYSDKISKLKKSQKNSNVEKYLINQLELSKRIYNEL